MAFFRVHKAYLLLGILSLLSFFNLSAQDLVLDGKVVDKKYQPLVGVHISLNDSLGTVSDEKGYYMIKVPSGQYHIKAQMIGFKSFELTLRLSSHKYYEIVLSPYEEIISDVVVSANRNPSLRKEVVVSMETLKPKLLETTSPLTMDDAIKTIPGLNVADGQVSIRGGAGYSYGAGSRVMVLYDGLPLLSADAGDVKWNLIPMQNISSIEVIKGASSSLYGSGALNGVLNIISSWPSYKPETKLSSSVGFYLNPSREELKWWGDQTLYRENVYLSHSQQIGRVDLQVGGEQVYDSGYRTFTYEKRQNANLKLRYRPKSIEGLILGISVLASNQDESSFFLWQNAQEGGYLQDSAIANPTLSKRAVVDPFINYSTSKWNHSLKMRYFYNKNDVLDDSKDNQYSSVFSEYLSNLRLDKFKLTFGANASSNEANSSLFNDHYSRGLAAFVQAEASPIERLKVLAGLRMEYFTLDEDAAASDPLIRFGLNYQINSGGNLRVSYGQAYRYPTIAEKYTHTSVGGLQILPNPNLLPEDGWNAEFGYYQGLEFSSFKGYIDLALFYTSYDNMMEFTYGVVDSITYLPIYDISQFGTQPVGFQSRNIGEARITGVEFTTAGQFQLGKVICNIYGGYTYTLPVDANTDSIYNAWKSEESNLLKYRFKHSFNFLTILEYKKLSLSYNIQYNSRIEVIDKFFELGLILPGLKEYRENNPLYLLNQDMNLDYKINERIEVGVAVKNIANHEYMVRPGDLTAPRMLLVKLKLNI